MNTKLAMMLLAAAAFGSFLAVTSARAQPPAQQTPSNADLSLEQLWGRPNAPAPPRTPTPLFKIGELPVGIWAPVAPPYNTRLGAELAVDPLWYGPSGP